jgi:hypothetical protein
MPAMFCWECGRKLRMPAFLEVEIDGHLRRIHKECQNPKVVRMKEKFYGANGFREEDVLEFQGDTRGGEFSFVVQS